MEALAGNVRLYVCAAGLDISRKLSVIPNDRPIYILKVCMDHVRT